MQRKKVWRYYCEYCGKANCSAGHMRQHERNCTMNPDRYCRMCNAFSKHQGLQDATDILRKNAVPGIEWEDQVRDYIDQNGPQVIERVRDTLENCPACILAALRQANVHVSPVLFNFATEAETYLKEKQSFDEWEISPYGTHG